MALNPQQVELLFSEALLRPAPAERAAYLDGACGDNQQLRARVEELLLSNAHAGDFLRTAISETLSPHLTEPRREAVGSHIGAFKLLQVIGEGGMGVVYL